jgi:hypothetical protein
VQYEYPCLSEIINQPDPHPNPEPRQHLWSQSKINVLRHTLKHYQKTPAQPVA